MSGRVLERIAGKDSVTDLREVAGNTGALLLIWNGTVLAETDDESVERIAGEIAALQVPSILAVTDGVSVPEELVAAASLCFVNADTRIAGINGETAAAEAVETGLVNGSAGGPDEVLKIARSFAGSICRLAPLAVKAALRSVREGAGSELEDGLDMELDLFCDLFRTEDMREGTRAFIEKRAPVFKGE